LVGQQTFVLFFWGKPRPTPRNLACDTLKAHSYCMGAKLHTPVLERYGPDPQAEVRDCEWPGCQRDGPHRAPYSRDNPAAFRWFCKEHAGQYNKAWNFFADMTDEEVEAIVRHDTVWNRPSWPIGSGPAINAFMRGQFDDPLGTFDHADPGPERKTGEAPAVDLGTDIRRALGVLVMEIPVQAADVKARYKELVKRHHPDAQGAAEDSDERIKEINHAYTVIMDFLDA